MDIHLAGKILSDVENGEIDVMKLAEKYSISPEEVMATVMALNPQYDYLFDGIIDEWGRKHKEIMNEALKMVNSIMDEIRESAGNFKNANEFERTAESKTESVSEGSLESRIAELERKVDELKKSIDNLIANFDEMRENLGFNKLAMIRNYIRIHETITVDNLTAIFGSYAKTVLNRLQQQGMVEKIARGIYKWKGNGRR